MNNKKLPRPLYVGALITANISIVIALMHLTLHFIDSVNFAMGFLKSDVTKMLMFILSISSLVNSIFVILILQKRESKSYFFRKVAFLTFWICFISIITNKNVILPNMLQDVHLKALWFFVSTFSMLTAVFCNGHLVMNYKNEEEEETLTEKSIIKNTSENSNNNSKIEKADGELTGEITSNVQK